MSTACRARSLPGSVDAALELLAQGRYVADRALATSLFLALHLGRPLLLEGEAGVGKTEVGKVVARVLGRRLIRLQCFEGLDLAQAVYEWNYARQMIEIRLAEAQGNAKPDTLGEEVFSPRFLIKRPLLAALDAPDGIAPVLLIDEIDRADEPFEAYLLEMLSEYQVTIPEIGTIRAQVPPIAIITSNRTRELHDALKRRCFYHWIDYPDAARELAILEVRVPEAVVSLRRQVVAFVQELRGEDLLKVPGVAETIDWTTALMALDKSTLDAATVDDTLGLLLKAHDDLAKIRGAETTRILEQSRASSRGTQRGSA